MAGHMSNEVIRAFILKAFILKALTLKALMPLVFIRTFPSSLYLNFLKISLAETLS